MPTLRIKKRERGPLLLTPTLLHLIEIISKSMFLISWHLKFYQDGRVMRRMIRFLLFAFSTNLTTATNQWTAEKKSNLWPSYPCQRTPTTSRNTSWMTPSSLYGLNRWSPLFVSGHVLTRCESYRLNTKSRWRKYFDTKQISEWGLFNNGFCGQISSWRFFFPT